MDQNSKLELPDPGEIELSVENTIFNDMTAEPTKEDDDDDVSQSETGKRRKPPAGLSAEEKEKFLAFEDLKEYICAFIKYNQNLMKINLGHCGLQYEMLRNIGATMSKARSLMSINMSGNPGVNVDLMEYI